MRNVYVCVCVFCEVLITMLQETCATPCNEHYFFVRSFIALVFCNTGKWSSEGILMLINVCICEIQLQLLHASITTLTV